jgi:transposase-like protein
MSQILILGVKSKNWLSETQRLTDAKTLEKATLRLSYRHVEEFMEERGVSVDHATINRWVLKYRPQLEEAFHRRERPVGRSWRMDETYIRVKGEWRYLYRAVAKHGQTIDFPHTEQRDQEAALRFLQQAIRHHGVPETITIDGSDAHAAAIKRYNEEHGTAIIIRQVKYLNNLVEQDHRAVKRVTRPRLEFKAFEAAQAALSGMKLMHMLKKGQWVGEEGVEGLPPAEQFYIQPSVSRIISGPSGFSPSSLKICDRAK